MTFPSEFKRADCAALRSNAGFSLLELLITMILILILSSMMIGRGMFSDVQKEHVECQKNLQNIYLALSIYAGDNNRSFPVVKNATTSEEPLSLLVPRSTTTTGMFICPASDDKKLPEREAFADRRISYAFYMGRLKTDGAEATLVSDRQVNTFPKIKRQLMFSETGKPPGANHGDGGGNVLFCDGSYKKLKVRATRDYLFPTNVILLNPKS